MTHEPHTTTDDAPASNPGNWVSAWLEMQRTLLARWQAAAQPDALHGMEALRDQFNPAAVPELLNVVQSFHTLLQSCMTGEFSASGATLWQSLLDAWPLGPAREQQLLWQRYLKAHAEHQLHLHKLLQAHGQVFAQSLEAVPALVEARAAQGKPVTGFRELYELWIECGEQAFAPLARDAQFIATQAANGNSLSSLKAAQQALFEQWLKQHDLPTRSELNSVHLRHRELLSRVNELERQLAAAGLAQKTTVRRKPRNPAK